MQGVVGNFFGDATMPVAWQADSQIIPDEFKSVLRYSHSPALACHLGSEAQNLC
jgi:hypothetical protein